MQKLCLCLKNYESLFELLFITSTLKLTTIALLNKQVPIKGKASKAEYDEFETSTYQIKLKHVNGRYDRITNASAIRKIKIVY